VEDSSQTGEEDVMTKKAFLRQASQFAYQFRPTVQLDWLLKALLAAVA
jgi:hypothetical protein